MGALDLATQQLVVIARALSRRARLLILDEPTAALTEAEAQRLFDRMRGLRDRGVTCVFVSHRLAEVFAIADRILVMRDGRLRGDHLIGETSREAIVAEMIGGSLVAPGAQSAPQTRASWKSNTSRYSTPKNRTVNESTICPLHSTPGKCWVCLGWSAQDARLRRLPSSEDGGASGEELSRSMEPGWSSIHRPMRSGTVSGWSDKIAGKHSSTTTPLPTISFWPVCPTFPPTDLSIGTAKLDGVEAC